MQSCVTWLAKHALLAWAIKVYAQLPAKIRLDVRAKVISLFAHCGAVVSVFTTCFECSKHARGMLVSNILQHPMHFARMLGGLSCIGALLA